MPTWFLTAAPDGSCAANGLLTSHGCGPGTSLRRPRSMYQWCRLEPKQRRQIRVRPHLVCGAGVHLEDKTHRGPRRATEAVSALASVTLHKVAKTLVGTVPRAYSIERHR